MWPAAAVAQREAGHGGVLESIKGTATHMPCPPLGNLFYSAVRSQQQETLKPLPPPSCELTLNALMFSRPDCICCLWINAHWLRHLLT